MNKLCHMTMIGIILATFFSASCSSEYAQRELNASTENEQMPTQNLTIVQKDLIWSQPNNDYSNGYDAAIDIAMADNAIFIVGIDDINGPDNVQWRVEKRNISNGELVGNFGNGGIILNDISKNHNDMASAIAISDDNAYIYVAGSGGINNGSEYGLIIEKRYADSGNLVKDFGINGMVSFN